ncbi:helix-turn-helix domain-containing protein [Streptomyces sp. NPDC002845]
MPRWRALPDELDPQVREFASQLRRLVDRSGLSIAAVADRTGYSKTSWERYLNGRLLAPKGAIVALAEVTGTNPIHLTTMWELAERAWSRSEMRHDMTMEAIRISQARAALGEFGTASSPPGKGQGKDSGRASRSATATPGVAGPAGVAPTIPPQAPAPGEERTSPAGRGGGAAQGPASAGTGRGGGSWGVAPSPADPSGPSRAPGGFGGTGSAGGLGGPGGPGGPGRLGGLGGPGSSGGPGSPGGPGSSGSPGVSAPLGTFGPAEPPQGARPGGTGLPGGPSGGSPGKRRIAMLLAGGVGALLVIGAAFFLTNGGGEDPEAGGQPSAPATSTGPDLPAGVKCSGEDCSGKDAEIMGCSGDLVTTTSEVTVGTTVVQVRYSETCGAAWGRITGAAQGDEVRVTVGTTKETGAISEAGDTIAYTPMVAVKDAVEATACVTLASGQEGCTE